MKKPLLITCLICFNILSVFVASGQQKPVQRTTIKKPIIEKCNCEDAFDLNSRSERFALLDFSDTLLNNNKGFTYETKEAFQLTKNFIDSFNNQIKHKRENLIFDGSIIVKKDDECAYAYGGAFSGPYYSDNNTYCLVFSSKLFDQLKIDKSEWFVIAHEVSHILYGHFSKNGEQYTRIDKEIEYLRSVLKNNFDQLKLIKNQFHEYQADFMGAKLLLNYNFNPKEVLDRANTSFKKSLMYNPKVSEDIIESRKKLLEVYLSKPIFPKRGFSEELDEEFQQYIMPLKDLYKDERLKYLLTPSEIAISEALSKLYDKSIQKIKKGDIANNAGKYCDALSTYQEIDSTLMILYPNSQIYKDNKEKINTIKAILQKPSNWNVELLGGGILSFPMLYSNNILVPTQGYNTPTLGLRLSQYSWYKKSRVEIDFRYTSLRFDTYSDKDVIKKAIERFDLTQLSISPHLVYSSTGSKNDTICASRFGFLMSFGFSANIMLKTKYTNFYTNESPLLKTGISPGVYIGIGGERLERKMKNTYIRAMITFQAQNLPFKTETSLNQNYSAWSYQVGAELSIRFWKL